MKLVPNISAPLYTTIAFSIGILLSDDLTPAEQNSLGNWFMMIGQALCSNSAQQQLLNNRNNTANEYNSHVINDNILKDQVNNLKNNINDILKRYN